MSRTWAAALALLAMIVLGGCGGSLVDSSASPAASLPAGASPAASGCTGSDASIPPGQADTFAEGKDSAPTKLPDGLQYVDLAPGGGPKVQTGQCVTIHYSLFLQDGTAVESSRNTQGGGAFKFQAGAGSVIKGFDEGVQGMSVGGRRRLTVPPALGYGAAGQPPKIPANSTLVFVIQVMKVS